MEASPLAGTFRLLKNKALPLLVCVIAAAPLDHARAQAADPNKALNDGMIAYRDRDYPKAIENLTAVVGIAKDKTPESVFYCLGFAHYNQKNYDEAAKIFQQYVAKYPETLNTPEVQLFLGRSLLQLDGKVEEALKALAAAARNPELLEEARFSAADAYIKKGDVKKAAEVLENAIKEKVSGPALMRACLQLADLYITNDDLSSATSILRRVENSAGYPNVIVAVNHRLVQIGDKQLQAKDYPAALKSYSNVRPQVQVLAIQEKRITEMQARVESLKKGIETFKAAKKAIPARVEEQLAMYTGTIESMRAVLDEVKKMADYDAILQYRIARCYFNMERYWPSTAGFEAIYTDFPKFPDAATAMFGAVVSQWKLGRSEATRALALKYIERFPEGANLAQVAELNGTLLLQDGLNKEAAEFLADYLVKNPKEPNREKFAALLANARFAGGDYDAAASDYEKLKQEFPSSAYLEEWIYRRALCDFLRNDYDNTLKSFAAYDQAYPTGQFQADVTYRRGIILLAQGAQAKDLDKKAAYFNQLITSISDLSGSPASENFRGPLFTLLGDAYSARNGDGDATKAATAYANAVKNANGDNNVIQYALEEATKMLRGEKRYDDLADLWKKFLEDNPGHAMELRGVSELSKLLVRAKKYDEAKTLLIEKLRKDIHNPRSEYAEMLISQLANLYVPQRVIVKKGETPPPPPPDPEPQLVEALSLPEDQHSGTYLARVLFAKSELARMMKNPEKNKLAMTALANTARPEDLSPILLSIVGQFLFDAGKYDEAAPFFQRLSEAFPGSFYADAGPVGLGRIALAKKDYNAALAQFDKAIASPSGSTMLKEATFGKAQALFYLNKRPEAKTLFEDIIKNKEWRGVEKAGSLYFLGEIFAVENDKAKASYYFNQVYLSYKGIPEYAAKAYLRSSEVLRSNGQLEEANATLREFLDPRKNPQLKDTPEAAEARKRVK